MADFSRPLHRNHASSAILSKKLSNVHSFAGKSMYDGVFATPSKLKAPIFSSRVEDYSEIFNSSSSSSASSIPVLDLPAVDKRDGVVSVPNSESDYSKIFGGFNDIDINGDCSFGEARVPVETKSSSDTSDADFLVKNQVPSQDATYQSVDGKKELKMFYNKTNIGINDGLNGTTHIAQLHAVPGFTCIIDEITPLKKTEADKPVPPINDVNPTSDIFEGLMEGKHCRKASSNLPDSGSKDVGDCNGSNSDGVQFNACDIDVNGHRPKVMPSSSTTPNLGNINISSKKASSVIDESPVFSDEEVDTNSAAAASAAAVRKAIEMAQASIRLAKEAMERKKGLQSSVKHSSKNGLKVKEAREINITTEAKRFKEKKSQKINETEETIIQNFPCTDGQSTRTDQLAPNLKEWKNYIPSQGAAGDMNGKQSEVLLAQNKQEGQRKLESAKLSCDFINTGKYGKKILVFEEDIKKEVMQTVDGSDQERWETPVETFELLDSDGKNSKVVEEAFDEQFRVKSNAVKEGAQESENHFNILGLPEIEDKEIEKKLEVAQKQVETVDNLKVSQEQGKCEEELTEFQELVENENNSTIKKWEHDDYEKGLKESQKPLETEIKLKQAHEGKKFVERLKEDYENEEKERKIKELLEQEIFERRLKEASECLEDEKKPTVPCEWEVNEKKLKDAHTGLVYESGLKMVQELQVNDCHGGKSTENIRKEDFEREGYEKIDEAWKQEKNDSILEEAGQKEGNERKDEEAYKWEDIGLKQRHPYQRDEDKKNIKATQDSLTNMEKNDQKTCDACENLSGAGETYRDRENNVEATRDVLAHEESSRMIGETKASIEPEEIEEGSNAVEVVNELADEETFGKASLDRDAIDGDDDQIDNYVDDVSEAFLSDDEKVNGSKENENELKAVDVANELEEKEMLETASLAEDEFEQNEIENNIKDERGAFFVDDSGLSLGEANMNTEHEEIDQNNKEFGFACSEGAHLEKLTQELGEINKNTEEAEVAFDQVEEINHIKAAYVDKLLVKNEKKMEASELSSVYEGKGEILEAAQENKTSQNTEQMKKNLNKTQITDEREAKESMHEDVMLEKEHLGSRGEAKEKERERERERLAVERAIREARQRAFTEARERAEKASMEKATAEARQRVNIDVRERLDKAAAGANSLAAKVSMEAKLKAERAAVDRATAEARERALEKALSEKAALEATERQNNGMRHSFSSSDQYQGSGPSTSFKPSNSSNYGVPSASERFDDGARTESTERCKAIEKHQRIVERAAKALEEKNKRDLLAQKEQAERNRFAEALDADVKRWSSGKAGNLRALLSTLQYILGPNSGWQPVPLTDIVSNDAVKKAYRKATLFVHPDKLQQRGASIQQKYICEKVFDLLKEAWSKFNSEER